MIQLPINKKCIVWTVVLAFVVLASIFAYIFVFRHYEKSQEPTTTAAVVSNGIGCADVGIEIFKDGGCHVDAIIATALCEGVMLPQSMGLGGGFVATIYTKGKVETLIAREIAPAAATRDMFVGQTEVKGALSIAVPGELRGYWELHKKYGCLSWRRLFEPTIMLCKDGHVVSKNLEKVLNGLADNIRATPSLREIFVTENNTLYKEGDYVKRPKLAATLDRIAKNGVNEIYNGGETGKRLLEDIRAAGGIVTEEDLKSYKVRWAEGLPSSNVNSDLRLYSTPLPSSGPILGLILNVMNGLPTNDTLTLWHRVVETFKHAYGQRSNLGDMEMENDTKIHSIIEETLKNLTSQQFANDIRKQIFDNQTFADFKHYDAKFVVQSDHGTANIAVLAPNGDAIVMTSTINNYFGSKIRSVQTGIILNNEMDDFSTTGITNIYDVPPSPTNNIRPGKIPLSSMCPSIILDACGNVRMLIGAAGGTKITTSVATAILKYLMLNETLERAVNDGRLHHQLFPMQVYYEPEVSSELQWHLANVGHVLTLMNERTGFAAVTAIGVQNAHLEAIYDRRRGGSTAILPGEIDARQCHMDTTQGNGKN